jgi:hypothetical protein
MEASKLPKFKGGDGKLRGMNLANNYLLGFPISGLSVEGKELELSLWRYLCRTLYSQVTKSRLDR